MLKKYLFIVAAIFAVIGFQSQALAAENESGSSSESGNSSSGASSSSSGSSMGGSIGASFAAAITGSAGTVSSGSTKGTSGAAGELSPGFTPEPEMTEDQAALAKLQKDLQAATTPEQKQQILADAIAKNPSLASNPSLSSVVQAIAIKSGLSVAQIDSAIVNGLSNAQAPATGGSSSQQQTAKTTNTGGGSSTSTSTASQAKNGG